MLKLRSAALLPVLGTVKSSASCTALSRSIRTLGRKSGPLANTGRDGSLRPRFFARSPLRRKKCISCSRVEGARRGPTVWVCGLGYKEVQRVQVDEF